MHRTTTESKSTARHVEKIGDYWGQEDSTHFRIHLGPTYRVRNQKNFKLLTSYTVLEISSNF